MDVLVDNLTLPEGPRWHEGRLWFSDFFTNRVLAVDLKGRLETIVEVPNRPSGLGWRPDGTMLIVSMLDRQVLRLDQGKLHTVADLSDMVRGPTNDMVVDGKGRAYVGNTGRDKSKGEPPRPTCLICIYPDGRIVRVAEDIQMPNGTAISADGKTMILAETLGNRLSAFDVAEDGSLSNRRVFAELPNCEPDGICLDAEGAVWVANPIGHSVLRVFDGGRVERQVPLGDRHSYAVMLAGEDRRTLCICTSDRPPGAGETGGGRIETVQVDVPGVGWP